MNGLKNVAIHLLLTLGLVAALAVPGLAFAGPSPDAPLPPASRIATPSAIGLTDTGWVRVDASKDGSHKAMYFGPGGVLVIAEVNLEGQVVNKMLGRYTQEGDKVILRDSDGKPVVDWTMTRDDKGYIHMTRDDGEETVWMPLYR